MTYFQRGNDTVCETFKVQKDDIIIVSSDGLYDNLEFDEIEAIYQKVILFKIIHKKKIGIIILAIKYWKIVRKSVLRLLLQILNENSFEVIDLHFFISIKVLKFEIYIDI